MCREQKTAGVTSREIRALARRRCQLIPDQLVTSRAGAIQSERHRESQAAAAAGAGLLHRTQRTHSLIRLIAATSCFLLFGRSSPPPVSTSSSCSIGTSCRQNNAAWARKRSSGTDRRADGSAPGWGASHRRRSV